jgi:phenylacetate-CoA ligase
MDLWGMMRFGARALALKAVATGSRETIERKQRQRLERLVRHAKEHSPYLAEKYAEIDVESVRLEDLPTSNKTEIMEHFDQWLTVDDVQREDVETFFEDESNLGKLFRDKYVLSHTSGSTGQALLLVKRPDDFELMFALQASRGHRTSLDLKEMITRFAEPVRLAAVTLRPGFYPSGSAFEYMPEGVRNFIDVLQLTLNDDRLIERLSEFKPTHLTTYSSIMHELARRIEAGELDLGGELEQVVNISEKLMSAPRRRYAELFNAPVLDDYGMGECLFLTSGCMTSDGMHVNADWAIVEVVDDDHRPVPAGERGTKILLTNLANRVQPFIRYEVGDIVVMASEPCKCDTHLPLIAQVEGRSSEMLYAPANGHLRPFHPAIVEQAIGESGKAREYQLIQQSPERLEVRIEPMGEAEISIDVLRQTIVDQLARSNVHGVEVNVEVVDRLAPDDGEGKFKRVISEVEPDAVA